MDVHAMITTMQSGMMGDGMMSGMMGGGMLLGWLLPLLALAGLTVLVIWAVRSVATGGRRGGVEDEALRTVRRRYARGEIDREEFRSLRSELTFH